jgi:DNA-binding NtrC family response regulator
LRRLAENRADDLPEVDGISLEALNLLKAYPWPGNVRELLNIVERACSFCDGNLILPVDLPDYVVNGDFGDLPMPTRSPRPTVETYVRPEKRAPFKEAKEEWIAQFEKDYIFEALSKHNGNISKAAREADIDRKYFRKLMSKHAIETENL